MSRRASVWNGHAAAFPWEHPWVMQSWDGAWEDGPHEDPHWAIEDCPTFRSRCYPTHAEALAAARAEVGLTPKEQS